MGHPFSRLIECLLSASSDLFYSPFLPLRFFRSSIFFRAPPFFVFLLSSSLPLKTLCFLVAWQHTHLPSAYFLQLTPTLGITCCFLNTSDELWGGSVIVRCTFSFKSISRIQKRDFFLFFFFPFLYFFFLQFNFFTFCHSVPFLLMLSLSPFGSQLVSWSFCTTLFSLTIIKPYFPCSSGLNVLAHKGTNPHLTYTSRTFISYCTFNFKAKNILFILRFPLNLPSPGIERYSFITMTY